jgi:hypothetical protein
MFVNVIKFISKDVICQYKYFDKFIVNEDSENRGYLKKLIRKYNIKKIVISVYHSYVNEMIEKKYLSVINIY